MVALYAALSHNLGPEIFVQINRILTKFCRMKVRGSSNYDTPCIKMPKLYFPSKTKMGLVAP